MGKKVVYNNGHMKHVRLGRLCGKNTLFYYIKGGGKYDYALNSNAYDKFSKKYA